MFNAVQMIYLFFSEIEILIHPERKGTRLKEKEQLLTEV